eukprot:jgi/Orpsp1_1/1182892/evm.model.c7180000083093.1
MAILIENDNNMKIEDILIQLIYLLNEEKINKLLNEIDNDKLKKKIKKDFKSIINNKNKNNSITGSNSNINEINENIDISNDNSHNINDNLNENPIKALCSKNENNIKKLKSILEDGYFMKYPEENDEVINNFIRNSNNNYLKLFLEYYIKTTLKKVIKDEYFKTAIECRNSSAIIILLNNIHERHGLDTDKIFELLLKHNPNIYKLYELININNKRHNNNNDYKLKIIKNNNNDYELNAKVSEELKIIKNKFFIFNNKIIGILEKKSDKEKLENYINNRKNIINKLHHENHEKNFNFSGLVDILIYSIENDCSMKVIEYIINNLYETPNYTSYYKSELTPLMYSIINDKFTIASLLLKNNALINYRTNYGYDIFEYLFNENLMTEERLKFILNNKYIIDNDLLIKVMKKWIENFKSKYLEIVIQLYVLKHKKCITFITENYYKEFYIYAIEKVNYNVIEIFLKNFEKQEELIFKKLFELLKKENSKENSNTNSIDIFKDFISKINDEELKNKMKKFIYENYVPKKTKKERKKAIKIIKEYNRNDLQNYNKKEFYYDGFSFEWNSPLFNSIAKNQFEIANLLLEKGADINYEKNFIKYLYEIKNLDNEKLEYILKHGFCVKNSKDNDDIINKWIKYSEQSFLDTYLKYSNDETLGIKVKDEYLEEAIKQEKYGIASLLQKYGACIQLESIIKNLYCYEEKKSYNNSNNTTDNKPLNKKLMREFKRIERELRKEFDIEDPKKNKNYLNEAKLLYILKSNRIKNTKEYSDQIIIEWIQNFENIFLEIYLKFSNKKELKIEFKDIYYEVAIKKSNYDAIIILFDNDKRDKNAILSEKHQIFDNLDKNLRKYNKVSKMQAFINFFTSKKIEYYKRIKFTNELLKNDKNEIEKYISDNNLYIKKFNTSCFDLLIFSIKNNLSYDIINLIIEKCDYTSFNYAIDRNIYGLSYCMNNPIYSALEMKNFKVSNLLISKGADINYILKYDSDNENDEDVLNYLYRNNKLNDRNFIYLLNNNYVLSNIDDNDKIDTIVDDFIRNKEYSFLEIFFKLSTTKYSSKIKVKDDYYLSAYKCDNYKAFIILLDNDDDIEDDINVDKKTKILMKCRYFFNYQYLLLYWSYGFKSRNSNISLYDITCELKIPPLSGICALAQLRCFRKWKNSSCIIESLLNNIPRLSHFSWTKGMSFFRKEIKCSIYKKLKLENGEQRQLVDKIFQSSTESTVPYFVGIAEFLTNIMPFVCQSFKLMMEWYNIRPTVAKSVDVEMIRHGFSPPSRRASDTESNDNSSNGVIFEEWEKLEASISSKLL